MCTDLDDFWYATLQMNTNHYVMCRVHPLPVGVMLTSMKWHIDVLYGNHIVHVTLSHCYREKRQSSATKWMCDRKFLHWVFLAFSYKVVHKNYENWSVFVKVTKVTARKSLPPFIFLDMVYMALWVAETNRMQWFYCGLLFGKTIDSKLTGFIAVKNLHAVSELSYQIWTEPKFLFPPLH